MGSDQISATDVYKAIDGLRKDVQHTNEMQWKAIRDGQKCQTGLKLEDARLDKEITTIKIEKKIGERALERHAKDQTRHFQPYYSETIPQRLWRKKPEIAAGGSVGTILGLLVLAKQLGWF